MARGYFSGALPSLSACILGEMHQAQVTPLSTFFITSECGEEGRPTAAARLASQPAMETEIQGFSHDISWPPSHSPHTETVTQVAAGCSCHSRYRRCHVVYEAPQRGNAGPGFPQPLFSKGHAVCRHLSLLGARLTGKGFRGYVPDKLTSGGLSADGSDSYPPPPPPPPCLLGKSGPRAPALPFLSGGLKLSLTGRPLFSPT